MVVGRRVEKVRQITRQKQGMVCRRLVRDWVVRPQASAENDSWRISKRTKEHNAEKFRNPFGDAQFAEPPSFPFLLGSVDEGLETSKRRLAAGSPSLQKNEIRYHDSVVQRLRRLQIFSGQCLGPPPMTRYTSIRPGTGRLRIDSDRFREILFGQFVLFLCQRDVVSLPPTPWFLGITFEGQPCLFTIVRTQGRNRGFQRSAMETISRMTVTCATSNGNAQDGGTGPLSLANRSNRGLGNL
jgi:hypothetical protein